MRHPEGSRFERRLSARKEKQANRMTPSLPRDLQYGRPVYGYGPSPKQMTDREKILAKFGDRADDRQQERRQVDRRQISMSPQEVEDWMRMNGIVGGDRRKGQRRQGDRRR